MPTCYPGLVYIRGQQVEADAKKMASVSLEGGKVEISRARLTASKPEYSDRTKGYKPFGVSDLPGLKKFGEDHPPFTHALAAIACSGARPMVSSRSPYNCAKALLGRVFRKAPARAWGTGPKPGVWKKAWQFVDLLFPGGLRAEEMSVPEWIQSMPSRRREPLRRAAERLERTGWMPHYELFSSFVKTELLPAFSKHQNGELLPLDAIVDRLIQGPADEAHCLMGPKLKQLTKELKRVWNSANHVFYASSGPEELHKFLQEKLCDGAHQYFWCDFSMYDNTHSKDSWGFLGKLYRRAGIIDPLFWTVFDAWMSPSGKIGPLKYKARVMNASGRDDTALANAILNGVATTLSIIAALAGKSVLSLSAADVKRWREKFSLSVCGDDSLGALPPFSQSQMESLRSVISANLAEFGFEAKLGTSPRLEDAVYLGMRPYPTRQGWFWGKTIGRSTYKMGWATIKGKNDLMAHITGVADMHVLCSSHVPILSDLAHRIVALRTGMKRTPPVLDANRPWEWTQCSGVQYDDVTLMSVAETYGVSVGELQSLITQIHSIDRLPAVIDSPVWRRMIWVDDL